jgi:hypothetical protein
MLRELTSDENARRSCLDRAFVDIKELILQFCPDVRERSEVLGYLELAQAKSIHAIAAKIPSCLPFADVEFYESFRRR